MKRLGVVLSLLFIVMLSSFNCFAVQNNDGVEQKTYQSNTTRIKVIHKYKHAVPEFAKEVKKIILTTAFDSSVLHTVASNTAVPVVTSSSSDSVIAAPKNKQKIVSPTSLASSTSILKQPSEQSLRESYKIPEIAIMITHLGLDDDVIEEVFSLPNCVGIGITPYAHNFQKIIDRALSNGRDVAIYIPTQPHNASFEDEGDYALSLKHSTNDNHQKLNAILGMCQYASKIKTCRDCCVVSHLRHDEVFAESDYGLHTLASALIQARIPLLYYRDGLYEKTLSKISTSTSSLQQFVTIPYDIFAKEDGLLSGADNNSSIFYESFAKLKMSAISHNGIILLINANQSSVIRAMQQWIISNVNKKNGENDNDANINDDKAVKFVSLHEMLNKKMSQKIK